MASNHCSVRALGWGQPLVAVNVACAPAPTFEAEARTVVLGGGTAIGVMPATPISDADVERIAQRSAELVIELLKEAKNG